MGRAAMLSFVMLSLLVSRSYAQGSCGTEATGTSTLKEVLLQNLVNVTTKYFIRNSEGSDGFRRVRDDVKYELFDLFSARYGGEASTAGFLSSFLDMYNSNFDTLQTPSEHLSKVIGLIGIGEFDEARSETLRLIMASIQNTSLTLDINAVTNEQVDLLVPILDSIFSSIEAANQTSFPVYLSLQVGSTLAFAIDTTGSMAGEIEATKQQTINIINSTKDTTDQPLVYVLSPFNDPGFGPLLRTNDPEEMIAALNALRANGGDDLPELSLKGIEQAILVSTKRSIVFMVTDADAKDPELESRVIALAIIKKIRVITLQTVELNNPNGFDLYNRISKSTGGLVTVTDKSNLEASTRLFTVLTAQGQVKLAIGVDSTSPTIAFDVDSTITEVSILLTGKTGFLTFKSIELNGMVVAHETLSNASGLVLLKLTNPAVGKYQINLSGNLRYSYEVSGKSIFGVIPTLLEVIGNKTIHRAQVRAGQDAHIVANLFGDLNGTSLERMRLIAQNGTNLFEVGMTRCGGSSEEYRTSTTFRLPATAFYIALEGHTRDGHQFTRVDSCAVSPLATDISLDDIEDQTIDAGTTRNIIAVVKSSVSTSFQLDISDPLLFASLGTTITGTSISSIFTITITIPSDAKPGSLSRVTLTAVPSNGNEFLFTSFNVIVRDTAVKCPVLISRTGSSVACSDLNNVGSQCNVTCSPYYVIDGAENAVCTSSGTWTVGSLGCTFVGRQTCGGTGDPHYLTFDGKSYDFQGTCVYTAVETTFSKATNNLEAFTVLVENEHLGNTRVSWFKRAFVTIYNNTFEFQKGKRITVNHLLVTPPFSLPGRGLEISLSGGEIVMTTSFGLTIRYNGKWNFFVELSGSYAGQVTGLCGNMNKDPSDDLALASNASILVNEVDFGNSHKVGGAAVGCKDGRSDDGTAACLDRDEYSTLCGVVDGDCFQKCRAVISTPRVVQNCIFDMCITEGDKRALEQALSEYADQCQREDISICDWRTETGTVPDCQANAHYEHEAVACPNTCLSPDVAGRCLKPPVADCVCNNGFVLSGEKCVPLSECGCAARGQYYERGVTFLTPGCSERCTCMDAKLDCVATSCETGEICQVSATTNELQCVPSSFSECSAWGDPHYTSFDGRAFDFQGACTYTFVEAIHPISGEMWRVVTENEFRGSNTKVSWLKLVTVELTHMGRNVSIVMQQSNDRAVPAYVNNLYNESFRASELRFGQNRLFTSGSAVIVELGNVRVTLDGYTVKVKVPGAYARQTRGLCGDFDGNSANDYQMPNSSLTSDVNVFGKSWRVGSCVHSDPPPVFVCPDAERAKWSAMEYCGSINATTGFFDQCRSLVDLERIFEECIYDVCATNDITIIDRVKYVVAEQCRANGLPVCDWMNQTGVAVPTCPENSRFEACTSACPDTCQDPYASDKCDLPDIDACVCNFGFVWENGSCVREKSCGCYPDDRPPVPQGYQDTNADCTFSCACNGPGKWECGSKACAEDELCLPSGSTYRCVQPNANCLIWGESLVSTFDSRRFNFDGTCAFIAVSAHAGESWPAFSVIVDKNHKDENGYSGMKTFVVVKGDKKFHDILVTATTGFGNVMVNGLRVNLGSYYKGLIVAGQGTFIVLRFDFGLTLRLASNKGIIVSLNGKLLGQTAGLCGFFDNNPLNDFAIDETGALAADEVVFGNFWVKRAEEFGYLNGLSKCSGEVDVQTSYMCSNERFLNFIRSDRACAYLRNSLFVACSNIVDVTAHEAACVKALCKDRNFLQTLETTFLGYEAECAIRGFVRIPSVRDDIGIKFSCPKNSHYSENSPVCQAACADRDASVCLSVKELATAPSMQGCVCDDGYIWSGKSCVPVNRCGCVTPEGLYFMHGECQVNAKCDSKCQCRNGRWNCEARRCRSDQYCSLREGVWGCHYQDACKYDNGGCSHLCVWSNDTTRCGCPFGYGLSEDNMTCIRLSELTSYQSALSEWRESYMEWQNVLTEYKAGKNMRSGCQANWTEWIDSDNATGCGDDESLKRIRYMYPNLVCEKPVAMETRVVDSSGVCLTNIQDVPLRLESANEGLLCDNSDQMEGVDCPDFAVRFLCFG